MSYQYNNIPTVEESKQEANGAGDNSMAYPPNANNVNASEGSGAPDQQQYQQQPPPPSQHQQQQQQHQQQQQPYGGARAYMPTYHDYMQSNVYGNGMTGLPSSFGSYGPNVGSSAWSQYIRHSKRNRIMVAVVIGIFLLLVTSHSSSSASSASNIGKNNKPTGNAAVKQNGIAGDGTQMHVNNNESPRAPPVDSNVAVVDVSKDHHSAASNGDNNGSQTANDSTVDDTAAPAETTPELKLAYLLTYPMSGTSYTMFLATMSTNRTVATNYFSDAQEDPKTGKPIPVIPDGEELGSPYWWGYGKTFSVTQKPGPNDYVLTLTHCGGYCLHPCPPEDYIESASLFEESCRLVVEPFDDKGQGIAYITPKSYVQKLVHLIRDPFSNVVSRYHQYRMHHLKIRDHHDKGSSVSFHEWCEEIDSKEHLDSSPISSPFISLEIKQMMLDIPCHTEFFKYIAWHNHVVEMSWNGKYPTTHVYFEDYNNGEDSEEADRKGSEKAEAMKIAEFLETPISQEQAGLPPFLKVNMYGAYFSSEQKANVEKFVRAMALTETMAMLERYFKEE